MFNFQLDSNTELFIKSAIAILVAFLASSFIKRVISISLDKEFAGFSGSKTSVSFLKNSISFIIYFIVILYLFYSVPFLNSLGQTIFASATVVAAIVGFASQKAISNIISGILIVSFRSIRIGDVIQIVGYDRGIVEDISLMYTVLRDYEHRRIVIPNNIALESVVINSNLNDDRIRRRLIYRFTLDSNLDKAYLIIRQEIINHPLWIDGRSEEQIERNEDPVFIYTTEIGSYYINVFAYAWVLNHDDSFVLQSDVYKKTLKHFALEDDIKIAVSYLGKVD
jgi:small-conductance mechanosensitive channel